MDFITGNKFKKLCDYVLDENGFIKTEAQNHIPFFFVKVDFIDLFFQKYKPNFDFYLITHNGDNDVSEKYDDYLNDKNLLKWYSTNINHQHIKLKSIPIGIANEIWSHGNELIFDEIINEKNTKNNLIYANFDVNTNISERNHCLKNIKQQGIILETKKPFKLYLKDISESYFVISPNGNGIDCHKTWESLYLKTIPIVTKSTNINFYNNLPILIINDWDEFRLSDLSIELYEKLWYNFDINKLNVNYFIS